MEPGEPLWVAVSGGLDSMVLLHVLGAIGHPCHVCHVDHGLRGSESDADRLFVEQHCSDRGIPFQLYHAPVRQEAAATGESMQMAARSLRLTWFHELVAKGPGQLAMAHHADDAIETFFMGLVQGMGLHGWGSIPVRSGPFIRPLLSVHRSHILAYALANGISWREDRSNTDTKYLRNRVRHELLPLLNTWRPGTDRNLARNVRLSRELGELAQQTMAGIIDGLLPEADGTLRVPLDRILGPAPLLVMHHLLRDKGFHPDQFDAMLLAIENERTGAEFRSDDTRVLVDRSALVIYRRSEPAPRWVISSATDIPSDAPLTISECARNELEHGAGNNVAWLDPEQVTFPLELRPWRAGDRMRPAGLGGSKLVSDILIDAKVPRDRKHHTYVLEQAGTILWLCGLRIAEGPSKEGGSERLLRLEWSGS